MKVHYINILLFAHALNILVNTHKKPPITLRHTSKIRTTRLLCECELYSPPNYDNDPQMKEVMQQFEDRTSQRFKEYDDRMVEKRKQCKDKCDKEIQKIILKDKIDKELTEKFSTLETKIGTDDIPTCICEKSIADKTEKFCLSCGKNMGAIAPWWGLVCGAWYAGRINAATVAAIELATQEGIKAGVQVVIAKIKGISLFSMLPDVQWADFIKPSNYNIASGLREAVTNALTSSQKTCAPSCEKIKQALIALPNAEKNFGEYIAAGEKAAAAETAEKIPIYTTQEMANVTNVSAIFSDPIIISAIVVVTIAVILLIIYLILRHRRKKKMKKKLKYIKLLEE
ncbi:PIR protein, putative [Plasmodium sp. DRC-Itaito]|nr:PIR protein, putative [Plasmodium sp. DRC-Itaito]